MTWQVKSSSFLRLQQLKPVYCNMSFFERFEFQEWLHVVETWKLLGIGPPSKPTEQNSFRLCSEICSYLIDSGIIFQQHPSIFSKFSRSSKETFLFGLLNWWFTASSPQQSSTPSTWWPLTKRAKRWWLSNARSRCGTLGECPMAYSMVREGLKSLKSPVVAPFDFMFRVYLCNTLGCFVVILMWVNPISSCWLNLIFEDYWSRWNLICQQKGLVTYGSAPFEWALLIPDGSEAPCCASCTSWFRSRLVTQGYIVRYVRFF